uniref:Fibronectin type-III domain-containing protein n=1 Tax=Heterorhabditis bacteriophora TaxID=37862 RepID=A0A1I7WV62_HETBA
MSNYAHDNSSFRIMRSKVRSRQRLPFSADDFAVNTPPNNVKKSESYKNSFEWSLSGSHYPVNNMRKKEKKSSEEHFLVQRRLFTYPSRTGSESSRSGILSAVISSLLGSGNSFILALVGPPSNVRVEATSNSSAVVQWDFKPEQVPLDFLNKVDIKII